MRPYEELVQFIASLSPRDVIDFKPSEAARARVWDLIERQKDSPLAADEKARLDELWSRNFDHEDRYVMPLKSSV